MVRGSVCDGVVEREGIIDSALEDIEPAIVLIVVPLQIVVQVVSKIEGHMLRPTKTVLESEVDSRAPYRFGIEGESDSVV